MSSGCALRAAAVSGVLVMLALVGAEAGRSHGVPGSTARSGPFAWEAGRLSCGVVGERPSRVRAHSRWRTSPPNGYQRATFLRQIRDEDTGAWRTLQRERRSTRNTVLEGTRFRLHWSQRFFPFADDGGATSRHVVRLDWLRDRPGADRLRFTRTRTLKPCVVRG
ncbi:MAG TPA: hypothetical protein VE644_06945 [Gaiellaceae bacterium]|jgi:hypothetical protein|nr:hypothetical protein [Gaiellaceae bacterium]